MSLCGKIRHATREDAENHLGMLRDARHEPKRRSNRLVVYQCKRCRGFHVGHQRTPRRKKRKD